MGAPNVFGAPTNEENRQMWKSTIICEVWFGQEIDQGEPFLY